METYRSGHNEAVSKTVRHVTVSRGFESHRLRQNIEKRNYYNISILRLFTFKFNAILMH